MKQQITLLLSFFFISTVSCQQPADQIKDINSKLQKNQTTITKILSDPSLMSLHSLTPFRELIKQHAKAETINIVTPNEPGTKITVKGSVVDKRGFAEANKLVYVYQTSSEGWYSDTAAHIQKNEGDRKHARLFGYLKTDSLGQFEFTTVKPKGYPNSALPAHIHIEIALSEKNNFISELLFDDDPRLIGEIRARSIKEKFIIAKNSGTVTNPVYSYLIEVPFILPINYNPL